MTGRVRALYAGWITLRDLVGGLLLGIALGAILDAVMKDFPVVLRRAVASIAALTILAIAGARWGRDMARYAGEQNERVGRTASIAFGSSVIIIGLTLSLIEPGLVARGADVGYPIHVVYRFVFVLAVLVVAGISAFALGVGMRDVRLGVSLAMRAGLTAALAFLVIDLVMDAIGWRVGAPNAARRATMLVVTALGAIGSAVAAGSVTGLTLRAARHVASKE